MKTPSKKLISPDINIGLTWLDDCGKRYTTVSPYLHPNGKRIVRLSISTCFGSIGAMHYYARLKIDSHINKREDDDGDGGHVGYLGKNAPSIPDETIEVTRILTKVEKDMSGTVLGKIGKETIRFNTEPEARKAAIKLFKKLFAPGWVLVVDSLGDDTEIITET